MTQEEEKALKQDLERYRDQLQGSMQDFRNKRLELSLGNIDKYRDFLQKIGELSFILGAAIIPIVIVSKTDERIPHLSFVIVGVGLYLLNGLLAFWKSKEILERNGDDTPHIGLDEEIHTYPIIHAHNKLIFDLNNQEYVKEYREASLNATTELTKLINDNKPGISLWSDFLISTFVVASLLIIRAIWPYQDWVYWLIFGAIVVLMAALTLLGYMRVWKNQLHLATKRDKLADINTQYQEWHNKNLLGN